MLTHLHARHIAVDGACNSAGTRQNWEQEFYIFPCIVFTTHTVIREGRDCGVLLCTVRFAFASRLRYIFARLRAIAWRSFCSTRALSSTEGWEGTSWVTERAKLKRSSDITKAHPFVGDFERVMRGRGFVLEENSCEGGREGEGLELDGHGCGGGVEGKGRKGEGSDWAGLGLEAGWWPFLDLPSSRAVRANG